MTKRRRAKGERRRAVRLREARRFTIPFESVPFSIRVKVLGGVLFRRLEEDVLEGEGRPPSSCRLRWNMLLHLAHRRMTVHGILIERGCRE